MTKTNKKALIVSYYWYPSGGIGTYRVSRFIKYLIKAGWEVEILTTNHSVSGLNEEVVEPEFEKLKVHRAKIIEPVGLLKSKKNKTPSTNDPSIFFKKDKSLLERFVVWVRLNLLLPDAKLTWSWFAVPLGKKVISSFQPDIIFSTSPPPTTQLVAKKLAAWSKIPWISDFRDPWTNIYYYDDSSQSVLAKKYNKHLETSVLTNADEITVVNHGFFGDSNDINGTKITNGFDPAITPKNTIEYPKFTLSYFGSLKKNQVPDCLLEALIQFEKNQQEIASNIQILFYGNVENEFRNQLTKQLKFIEVKVNSFVSHQTMTDLMYSADLLLFSVGKSPNSKVVLPTKALEYLPTGTPILGIGQTGGAAEQFINHTKSGRFFSHNDSTGVYTYFTEVVNAWHEKKEYKTDHQHIDDYSFEVLTKRLETIMLNLINR